MLLEDNLININDHIRKKYPSASLKVVCDGTKYQLLYESMFSPKGSLQLISEIDAGSLSPYLGGLITWADAQITNPEKSLIW